MGRNPGKCDPKSSYSHSDHNIARQDNQDVIDLTRCILLLEKRVTELEERLNNVEANEKWKGPLG